MSEIPNDKSEKEFSDFAGCLPDAGKKLFMSYLANEGFSKPVKKDEDFVYDVDGRQVVVTSNPLYLRSGVPCNSKSTIHSGVCHYPVKLGDTKDREDMVDLFAPKDKEAECKRVDEEQWTKLEQRVRSAGRMTEDEIQNLRKMMMFKSIA